jgi:hypothetical protein
MNSREWNRHPTVTLSATEGGRLRGIVREHGIQGAAKLLGINAATLLKAASEAPVARMTGDFIRGRLDRI